MAWIRARTLVKAPRRMGGRLRIENQVSTRFSQFERIAYAAEAAIAPLTTNLGFRRRIDAGLVTQEGRRCTRYHATDELPFGRRQL